MNKQIILQERPVGAIDVGKVFKSQEVPLEHATAPGTVLVQVKYFSLDPAMRSWMSTAKSYVPPVALGAVMRALAVGLIIESKNPKFPVGKYVQGVFGWQQYCLVTNPRAVTMSLLPSIPGIELTNYLSVLGITGLTAYFGLFKIGKPKSGETVLVSGAAGGVGSVVCQLAKNMGCNVVGLAGTDEKCKLLTESMGCSSAINYRTCGRLRDAVQHACPKGVDVFFDNVGGEILDVALKNINKHGRVVICGAISQYNKASGPVGPKNYLQLLVQRATMEGFVYFDYAREFPAAISELAALVVKNKLVHKEHIVQGLDTAPSSLLMLFNGKNNGKLIISLGDGAKL